MPCFFYDATMILDENLLLIKNMESHFHMVAKKQNYISNAANVFSPDCSPDLVLIKYLRFECNFFVMTLLCF